MKHKFKQIFAFAVIGCTAFFSSCDKGDPGPAGVDGLNGLDGVGGANGVGFDEAIRFGTIEVTLDGTRPDDEVFTKTITFRFAPADKDFSSYDEYESCGGPSFESTVKRYLVMDNNSADDYACAILEVQDCEGLYKQLTFRLKASIFFEDEHVYFNMDDYFYVYDDEIDPGHPEMDGDGNLTYTFATTNNENSTGHDLAISGTIDATVFEQISGGRMGGRVKQEIKNTHKAVMLPM